MLIDLVGGLVFLAFAGDLGGHGNQWRRRGHGTSPGEIKQNSPREAPWPLLPHRLPWPSISPAKARNIRPPTRSINTKFFFCVLIIKEQVQGSLWCSIRVNQAEVILLTSKGGLVRVVVLFSQAPPREAPWPLLPRPSMSLVIYIAYLITMCSYLVSFENNALGLPPTYFFPSTGATSHPSSCTSW